MRTTASARGPGSGASADRRGPRRSETRGARRHRAARGRREREGRRTRRGAPPARASGAPEGGSSEVHFDTDLLAAAEAHHAARRAERGGIRVRRAEEAEAAEVRVVERVEYVA